MLPILHRSRNGSGAVETDKALQLLSKKNNFKFETQRSLRLNAPDFIYGQT